MPKRILAHSCMHILYVEKLYVNVSKMPQMQYYSIKILVHMSFSPSIIICFPPV